MAGFVHAKVIEVCLWGQPVGAVAPDKATGLYAFQYDRGWLEQGQNLGPLHVGWHGRSQVFPGLAEHTWHRLPAFVADALPDEFGNAITTAWLARQGVAAHEITALDRLAYLGTRAMGALEFHPPSWAGDRGAPSLIQARDLVASAQKLLAGSFSDDDQGAVALRQLLAVGTSAGGQRAKAVVAFCPATREIRSGAGDLPAGFFHCLLKLDGVGPSSKGVVPEPGAPQGFGRVEYAYHLMARAAGLEMAPCDLLEENGRAHFITRRFDRDEAGGKIHTQTLCAMAHMDYKLVGVHQYDQLFHALAGLGATPREFAQAYLRTVFNVVARNCDDHPKNTAFMLAPDGRWRLAPAYDLTFAYTPSSPWVSRHLMGVAGKFDGPGDRITRQDLLDLAKRHSIAHANDRIDAVAAAVGRWGAFADQAGVPQDMAQHIATELRLDLIQAGGGRTPVSTKHARRR